MLPDGEPRQLTNDNRWKMSPHFSADGTRIIYSTGIAGESTDFITWEVSVLGGQPRQLLTNAEGLTSFTDEAGHARVLFSEMSGIGGKMAVVSATESRSDSRNVYVPSDDFGMAHRSYLSPNRKWVIAVEMDLQSWLPCRLVPSDGSSTGHVVGPAAAQCTDAGWSPDGNWMYFTASTSGGAHIWRQRFPDGAPEQVTSGVTEENGIAFASDGRSFLTSIGTAQSTVWVHDERGDRQVTSEGYSFNPTIAPDGQKLYYVVRMLGARAWFSGALWVADLVSGERRRLLPDYQIEVYDISRDGKSVVFTSVDTSGHTPVWIAPVDGSTPPRRLGSLDATDVFFGAPGEIVFGSVEKKSFVYRINQDGSELRQLISAPMLLPQSVSPDGQFVAVADPGAWGSLMVYPAGSGKPLNICDGCFPPPGTDPLPTPMKWTPDGRFVYVRFADASLAGPTYAIPLRPGERLPRVPADGFASKEALGASAGARLISDGLVYPGPTPGTYAYTKTATERNIYRVPVEQ